jgi:DNA-binding protein HU-beta
MASQGKGSLTHGNCEKALFTEKNRWSDCPRIVYSGGAFGASPSSRIQEEVPLMAMVPGKAPTPPTVTLKHLAAALAETHEMSKKQAETVLGDLVGNIVKHLKKGERIRIGGLGILQVRKRAARIGRNPATGEQIQIKASKKVAFRASKELKESI